MKRFVLAAVAATLLLGAVRQASACPQSAAMLACGQPLQASIILVSQPEPVIVQSVPQPVAPAPVAPPEAPVVPLPQLQKALPAPSQTSLSDEELQAIVQAVTNARAAKAQPAPQYYQQSPQYANGYAGQPGYYAQSPTFYAPPPTSYAQPVFQLASLGGVGFHQRTTFHSNGFNSRFNGCPLPNQSFNQNAGFNNNARFGRGARVQTQTQTIRTTNRRSLR